MPELSAAPSRLHIPDGRRKTEEQKLGLEGLSKLSGPKSIESEFADVIPKNISEIERERIVGGLAAAKFVSGFSSEKIRTDLAKTAEIVASPEKSSEQNERLAGLRFARDAKKEALDKDPLVSVDPEIREKFVKAVNFAIKRDGYTHDDVKKSIVDLVVQADGNKEKAALAFIEVQSKAQTREYGHKFNTSISNASDSESKTDKQAQQTLNHISQKAHDSELRSATANVTKQKNIEAEDDKKINESLKIVDLTAARVLKNREYAAFRVMRDNADSIGERGSVNDDSSTLSKIVADKMRVTDRHGRRYVEEITTKIKSEIDKNTDKIGESDKKQIDARLATPTEKLVADVTAHRKLETQILLQRRDLERLAAREKNQRYDERKKIERASVETVIAASAVKKTNRNVGFEL